MQELIIKACTIDATEPPFPELLTKAGPNAENVIRLDFGNTTILEHGTESGQSVADFWLTDKDGKLYFAELTMKNLCGLHDAMHTIDNLFKRLQKERVKKN